MLFLLLSVSFNLFLIPECAHSKSHYQRVNRVSVSTFERTIEVALADEATLSQVYEGSQCSRSKRYCASHYHSTGMLDKSRQRTLLPLVSRIQGHRGYGKE